MSLFFTGNFAVSELGLTVRPYLVRPTRAVLAITNCAVRWVPAWPPITPQAMLRFMQALTAGIGRDLPLTIALVFSRIAAAGDSGVLQATVQRELDLSPAGLTRSVQTLSSLHYGKARDGLGLIARTIDGPDRRHKTLRLTAKGEELQARLS
jgi:DNA-binding MarR family transcriptional regulator